MENVYDQNIRSLREIVTQTMQAMKSIASNSSDKTNVSKDTVDGNKQKSPTIIVEASETSTTIETKIVKIINGKKINLKINQNGSMQKRQFFLFRAQSHYF